MDDGKRCFATPPSASPTAVVQLPRRIKAEIHPLADRDCIVDGRLDRLGGSSAACLRFLACLLS